MEVFSQRLRQEHGASVISTAPQVTFRGIIHSRTEINSTVRVERNKEWIEVCNPSDWPDGERIVSSEEPRILATIVTPKEYMGAVLKLINVSN